MKWFIILSLILLTTKGLHAKDFWKHSALQGQVGACHTFSTIALIEAEYWRSTGKRINLSERDLFVRHYSKGAHSGDALIIQQLNAAARNKLPAQYNEAGHIKHDFALAKKHGVASEKELPYDPLFSKGVSMSIQRLRQQCDLYSAEVAQLKNAQLWSSQVATQSMQRSLNTLKGVSKVLTLPSSTPTRAWTKQWLAHYSMLQLKPKTSAQAKAWIIAQLPHRPVAVDLSNFTEISNHAQHFSPNYQRHSLVVSHYNPASDTFTIRSSTHKKAMQVSADALSRGTYHLYYLVRK